MVREVSKSDYTEDELKNLEAGKCWCGKPRNEFDKLMRVYCSIAHRTDWYARTIMWSSFKDEVLAEQGKKCNDCGKIPTDSKKSYQEAVDEWQKKIQELPNFRKMLDKIRIELLNELEKKYQNIMSDEYLIEHELWYEIRDNRELEKPNDYKYEIHYDVDHIIAVSLGGDMWDKKNLQVLCTRCHKIKTKIDMQKLRAQRKGLKPLVRIE